MKKFTLTDQHIKLIRRMNVVWESCETGAPAIDPKRPYGNSDVAGDIAEILEVTWTSGPRDDGMPTAVHDKLMALHRESLKALAIIVRCGDISPGTYSAEYGSDWALID